METNLFRGLHIRAPTPADALSISEKAEKGNKVHVGQ